MEALREIETECMRSDHNDCGEDDYRDRITTIRDLASEALESQREGG